MFVTRRKYERLLRAYLALRAESQHQLEAYAAFREDFRLYRERFDPIQTETNDNVITIYKGKRPQ